MAAATRNGNRRSNPRSNNKIKEKRTKEQQRKYSEFLYERHRIFGSLKWSRMAFTVRYSQPAHSFEKGLAAVTHAPPVTLLL